MLLAVLIVIPSLVSDSSNGLVHALSLLVAFAALPVSIGIAVLKYRLYDIDVVISRALVYGALAAFITAVYVGIVVGIGTLVGSGGRPNLVLSILAWRWWPWGSNQRGSGSRKSLTDWSMGKGQRLTKSYQTSPSASPSPTLARRCCPGWHRCLPMGPARACDRVVAPAQGCSRLRRLIRFYGCGMSPFRFGREACRSFPAPPRAVAVRHQRSCWAH